MTGIFSLPNTISSISAQNTSTNSIDVQSVKDLLDQAVESLNNGDITVALQQLDKAEDSLDVAEDKLEVMLGSNQ
jgi:type III secretory pathway lipoprotein EscJ